MLNDFNLHCSNFHPLYQLLVKQQLQQRDLNDIDNY